MAHDVFICHSAGDRELAETALVRLEAAGVKCYCDFRDTTAAGDRQAEALAAISSARVMLYIFTDAANMDGSLIKQLDRARRGGTEIVTLRVSNSLPLGRIGYYITIPYTVDAREGDAGDYLEELTGKIKETLATVDENRAKTRDGRADGWGFKLPGFESGRWYVSMLATVFYVFSVASVVMSAFSLRTSENLAEDVPAVLCLALLFAVPVLMLGNFLGMRDKCPLLKTGKPLITALTVAAADVLVFFFFDLLVLVIQKAR